MASERVQRRGLLWALVGGAVLLAGIIAIIVAKALDVEGTDDLNAPTPDELKSSIGGDDVRRRLGFDRDAAGA